MVMAPEHTELEQALMRRVWALEEALMSLVTREGFVYTVDGKDAVTGRCTYEVLDSLPWLAGEVAVIGSKAGPG